MNPQFWWYVTRASGMVAAVLLALTLIWGLLVTTKVLNRPGLPAWLTDLHRGLGGLTLVFIAIHLAAIYVDDYVHFSLTQIFVPFTSPWRTGAVALGIGAFWGLVVVQGSSLLQRRMKRQTWRRLHFLSYPIALLTALHTTLAGTDSGSPLFRYTSIGLIFVFTSLTLFRILHKPPRRNIPARRTATATAVSRTGSSTHVSAR